MFRGTFQRFIDRMVRVHIDNKLELARFFHNHQDYGGSGWFAATVGLLGFTLMFPITNCIGNSMSPTIDRGGDLALTDGFSHLIARMPYQVGEVVIAVSPTNKEKSKHVTFYFSFSYNSSLIDICKRIRAVEGQYVIYRDSYRTARVIRIPTNHVWLQGDNPSDSTDSRKYGPVSTDLIITRIVKKLEDIEPLPRTFEYLSLDIERDDLSYTLAEHDIPRNYRAVVANGQSAMEASPPLYKWLWDSFTDFLATGIIKAVDDHEKAWQDRPSQEQQEDAEEDDENKDPLLPPTPPTTSTGTVAAVAVAGQP